jgi:hypothetical protein
VYTHPGQEGGYGHGVNGIIEFNAEDLHSWLNVAPTNVAPTPRKQRSAPKGERIKEAIDELFPDSVPPQKDLPNPELIKRVRSRLEERGYKVAFHDDLILRQAGRKAKRSTHKARSLMPQMP